MPLGEALRARVMTSAPVTTTNGTATEATGVSVAVEAGASSHVVVAGFVLLAALAALIAIERTFA